MDLTSFMLGVLVCALATAWLAVRKGYSARTWFWLGSLLGLAATFILLLQPSRNVSDASDSV